MSEYRFTNSHVSKATLLADSTSIVESWTRDGALFYAPSTRNLIKPYTAPIVGLNGAVYGQGEISIDAWRFGSLSGDMFTYLSSTLFANALSTPATIQTLDQKLGTWRCFQVTANLRYDDIETSANAVTIGVQFTFSRPLEVV